MNTEIIEEKSKIKVNGVNIEDLSREDLISAFRSVIDEKVVGTENTETWAAQASTKIIFYRESFLQSVTADITSFTFLLFSIWFNYNFVGGSYFLNGIILIMFLLFVVGKSSGKRLAFNSIEDMEKHIQEIKNERK